uniref:Protein kinase domain-containing protein n=1 Tax=Attheya septentrionalis TaxID=420275 RepID=A0A7S2U6B1_9STRA|mmetsp:Transcript_12342/g.22409  ORF Transcript_12342/g.22409 Transcript_12342/m.22409 type:complete len:288 (+) Transcript_12342:436-1299(+)|eukprot:CAMPEP_0198300096 /NCGR_PEP_ID=MMETSP1449-20131203/46825_1 /TAXON_ID=420275 /ORGANISM="Attheya septentrionalis, Strain CCMP2084" /LENGTH=287 /DNA_ID=CAMNT_0044001819 /DNA_START=364 /DNA_END=1227 /DNA_ORIENTATION=+
MDPNNIHLPVTVVDTKTKRLFRLDRFLGKGTSGSVFECTVLETGLKHAIKVIGKEQLQNSEEVDEMWNEIKVHGSLKHTNICGFVDSFEDDENYYILMELCNNGSLQNRLNQNKRKGLDESEVKRIMMQLIQAVQFMHDKNIMHHDLKPDNIFLDQEGNVKLGDFGLAVQLASSDETLIYQAGTHLFMAPEMIEWKRHSFEADIWSLGVILYCLLTGKCPFRGVFQMLFQRIVKGEYKFPDTMSFDAKDLISSMLQADPADRPSLEEISCHEFFTGISSGVKRQRFE